jgi:hypothetical protein
MCYNMLGSRCCTTTMQGCSCRCCIFDAMLPLPLLLLLLSCRTLSSR